ncbi:MAG: phage/plasmid primase, P4 family [Archaeoglobaceae archaeon]
MRDYINLYISKNISFFPLFPSTKIPVVKHEIYYERMPTKEELEKWKQTYLNPQFWQSVWKNENNPLRKRWLEALQMEFKKIGRSLEEYTYEGEINIALASGFNDLIFVDIEEAKIPNAEKIFLNYTSYVVKTGKPNGYHLYFKCKDWKQNIVGKNGEIRANHQYVVAPPSRHPNGTFYRFLLPLSELQNKEVDEITKKVIEEFILPWIEAEEKKKNDVWFFVKEELKKVPVKKGIRSDCIFVATVIAKNFFDEKRAYEEICEIPVCLDKLNEKKDPYDWWKKYEWDSTNRVPKFAITRIFKWLENQIGFKFADEFYSKLRERIIQSREQGYAYEMSEAEITNEFLDILNRRVIIDENERMKVEVNYLAEIAKDISRMFFFATPIELDEAHMYRDGVYVKCEAWLKHMLQKIWSYSDLAKVKPVTHEKINEIIKALRKLTYVPLEKFDPPDYICLKNGIFNLKTFSFEPHNPRILFLKKLNVVYDPNAKSDEWDRFLEQVVDKKYHDVLYEFIGYCFLSDNRFEKALFIVGPQGSGKSTFLSTIQKIFDKYYSAMSLQKITSYRFALGSMYDKFVNIYADLPSDELRDTDVFREIVTGDSLDVEIKYKQSFPLVLRCKLIFSANQLPRVTEKNMAFFRRLIIIPFPNTISENQRNPELKLIFDSDVVRSHIFNKAIEGLKRLLQNKRFSYEVTEEEIADYYERASDPVTEFIDQHIVLDQNSVIRPHELYEKFVEFCKRYSYSQISIQSFSIEMRSRLPIQKKIRKGYPYWVGIKYVEKKDEEERGEEDETVSFDLQEVLNKN